MEHCLSVEDLSWEGWIGHFYLLRKNISTTIHTFRFGVLICLVRFGSSLT